jgi:uncharacterized membrane protein
MIVDRQAHGGHPHPPMLERLVFFSDAVFAIAITLLVIEIGAPHLPHGAGDIAHLQQLAQRIPNFIGFFVSFWVIAAFWGGHHSAFGLAGHYAPGLIGPNLAMLCAVAFMPFATAYMSENYGARVPAVLYNSVLLVTALLNLRLVRKVTAPPYLADGADSFQVATCRGRPWGVVVGATLALIVSFIAPFFAQMTLATIPLWIAIAVRRTTRGVPRP